jgi:hypothetical protein
MTGYIRNTIDYTKSVPATGRGAYGVVRCRGSMFLNSGLSRAGRALSQERYSDIYVRG